jgi:hypothetical protein
MQFAVPQFTDVEDKLIGPLTLKQFFIVLGFGGIIFFLWSVTGGGVIFFIMAVPIAAVGAYVTLKKFNGRPFYVYFLPLLSFLLSPRVMIFKRETAVIHFTLKQVEKPKSQAVDPASLEPTESRLKKLAYLLDRKNEEEKEIITHNSFLTESPKDPQPQVPAPVKPAIKTVNTLNLPENPKPKTVLPPPATLASKTPKGPQKFNPSDILKQYG